MQEFAELRDARIDIPKRLGERRTIDEAAGDAAMRFGHRFNFRRVGFPPLGRHGRPYETIGNAAESRNHDDAARFAAQDPHERLYRLRTSE